jgi:hypothetical protein
VQSLTTLQKAKYLYLILIGARSQHEARMIGRVAQLVILRAVHERETRRILLVDKLSRLGRLQCGADGIGPDGGRKRIDEMTNGMEQGSRVIGRARKQNSRAAHENQHSRFEKKSKETRRSAPSLRAGKAATRACCDVCLSTGQVGADASTGMRALRKAAKCLRISTEDVSSCDRCPAAFSLSRPLIFKSEPDNTD